LKIGLFFGSFNPIHIGHTALANYMAEFTDLDKVWFVVSPQNPLKEKGSLLSEVHRLALVDTAIEGYNKLQSSNIEFKLSKPSYTINTLVHLQEKYPKHQFVLILGSDNLQTFHKWKNYEQILAEYELYVYPRPRYDGGELANHPKVRVFNAPIIEISSSFIREAIKTKKDIRYFLLPSVFEYISEMNFYKK
jgi:nicotinate-nucleotide adenylyltransferase